MLCVMVLDTVFVESLFTIVFLSSVVLKGLLCSPSPYFFASILCVLFFTPITDNEALSQNDCKFSKT